jgi:hypothetical protein
MLWALAPAAVVVVTASCADQPDRLLSPDAPIHSAGVENCDFDSNTCTHDPIVVPIPPGDGGGDCEMQMHGGVGTKSHYCDDDGSGGGPPPDDGGPGGGGGGSGDDGHTDSSMPSLVNDDYHDAHLGIAPPDCTRTNLQPQEVTWCGADQVPSPAYATILSQASDAIISRCPYLSEAWTRVQGNVRVWKWNNEPYGGAAARGGDWILLSEQWLDHDPQVALTHELLHVHGLSHEPDMKDDFISRERECTGGRSAFD